MNNWEILEGKLIQSAVPTCPDDWNVIHKLGVGHVISLVEARDIPPWLNLYSRWLINDMPMMPSNLEIGWQIANTGAEAISRGYKVLVHCHAGCNRSGLMIGMIMHQLGFGDGEAILTQINSVHKDALFNPVFRHYISELKKI